MFRFDATMEILIDTREHKKEFERIAQQFDVLGVKYARTKLFVGDYQSLDNSRLVVDRKKDLLELAGNVAQDHERFKAELVRAMDMGISIIVLCEHGEGIKSLADVKKWQNPRKKIMIAKRIDGKLKRFPKYPYAMTGSKLFKILSTIAERYKVQFEFCDKLQTGERIVQLLGGGADG